MRIVYAASIWNIALMIMVVTTITTILSGNTKIAVIRHCVCGIMSM